MRPHRLIQAPSYFAIITIRNLWPQLMLFQFTRKRIETYWMYVDWRWQSKLEKHTLRQGSNWHHRPSLMTANRTRFLTSYFVNAFVSFNRRSHRYDSFNCLRIRKITGLKSPSVCGVFWRKTRLEDEVLLTQDEDEKRSGSPKYAIHGGFDLASSG